MLPFKHYLLFLLSVVIGQILQETSGQLWRLYFSPEGLVSWSLSPPDSEPGEKPVNNIPFQSSNGAKTAIPLNQPFVSYYSITFFSKTSF
jgi:hypothetical protein